MLLGVASSARCARSAGTEFLELRAPLASLSPQIHCDFLKLRAPLASLALQVPRYYLIDLKTGAPLSPMGVCPWDPTGAAWDPKGRPLGGPMGSQLGPMGSHPPKHTPQGVPIPKLVRPDSAWSQEQKREDQISPLGPKKAYFHVFSCFVMFRYGCFLKLFYKAFEIRKVRIEMFAI